MEFRTHVSIPAAKSAIDYSSRMMLIGSCFSEHIGRRLCAYKFSVDVNPFGIVYNPLSAYETLSRLSRKEPFSESDLFLHNSLYHSYAHHGDFSDINRNECLRKISNRFDQAAKALPVTDIFLITFGTAYVYKLAASGDVVNNCHKVPAPHFTRSRLTVNEVVEKWQSLISSLQSIHPNAKFIFTVSPVRHWKDGAHENQLSKSILHLSIEALQEIFGESVQYFPAYEIMMDELRDYRFYADDMMHPSMRAIDYIWERFSETYFSKETRQIHTEWNRVRSLVNHRPLNPQSGEYKKFIHKTLNELNAFREKYPFISIEEELDGIQKNRNNLV